MNMKKIYYLCMIAALCLALVCAGCVDEEYSLSNIGDGSDIRVGNVITTPPVTARISFEGLMGGMAEIERILEENNLTLEDLGKIPVDIGNEEFFVNLPLDIPLIPEGMLDMLGSDSEAGDKTELLLTVKSTLPMSVEFRLEFMDSAGGVILAFDELLIEGSSSGEELEEDRRQDITPVLARLSDIKGLNVTLLRPDAEKIAFLLENYIMIETRIEKSGGIRLPL